MSPGVLTYLLGDPWTTQPKLLACPALKLETERRELPEKLAAEREELRRRAKMKLDKAITRLKQATEEHEVPLVFDEVVTGFRLGLGGGQAYYGVTPDLCALGKSISAGHPLGVVCGRSEIMEHAEAAHQITGGYVSITGTYSGNPLSCAAALAAIEVLSGEGVYETLFARGRRLMQGLRALFAAAGLPVHVTGEPPAFQTWFADAEPFDHRSAIASDAMRSMRFTALLLERGVMKAHEKFFVSTAHDERDIELTLEAAESALAELASG